MFPEQGMFLLDLFYESRGRLQPLVRWQIDHLRGYGASNSVLKIETGRCVFVLTLSLDTCQVGWYFPQENPHWSRDFCVQDASSRNHTAGYPPLGAYHH